MLWNKEITYWIEPFEKEIELEDAVIEVADRLFGPNRLYLDVKKKISRKGGKGNIPDGYLIDLSSEHEPLLYVVENEIARHEPLRHIAVQILEFSLAFETSPQKVKEIIKIALKDKNEAFQQCDKYASENGFENVDVLLERMIYQTDSFSALVIIDEVSEDLEKALISRFQFPVEIVTLRRYKTSKGKRIYEFEPFLLDIVGSEIESQKSRRTGRVDPSDVDTIVVAARDDGFEEVFLGEDRWYSIRIHSSMIPRIKYIAAYRVAPISAITYIARVASIEPWLNSSKYVVNFDGPARKVKPIPLISKSMVKAPQAPRYTSMQKLEKANNLDEVF